MLVGPWQKACESQQLSDTLTFTMESESNRHVSSCQGCFGTQSAFQEFDQRDGQLQSGPASRARS